MMVHLPFKCVFISGLGNKQTKTKMDFIQTKTIKSGSGSLDQNIRYACIRHFPV